MIKVGLFSSLVLFLSFLPYMKEPNSIPTYGSCHRSWFSSSAIIQLNQVLPVLEWPNIQINCSARMAFCGPGAPLLASSGVSSWLRWEVSALPFAVSLALGSMVVLGELRAILYWVSMYL